MPCLSHKYSCTLKEGGEGIQGCSPSHRGGIYEVGVIQRRDLSGKGNLRHCFIAWNIGR